MRNIEHPLFLSDRIPYILDNKVMIPLQNKETAFTDIKFYDTVKSYIWHKDFKGYIISKKNRFRIKLHRLILGVSDKVSVDHINHNKLDNTVENLRVCSNKENCRNRKKLLHKRFKGVYLHGSKKENKWQAQIMADNFRYYLGHFLNEETAAQAYNIAAKELFKEFAWLNPVEDVESVVTTTGKVINKEYIQQLAQKAL